MTETKKCIKCGEEKPIERFPIMVKHRTVRPKRRAHCRACDKKLSRQRRELKRSFGPVPENYQCPVCLRDEQKLKETTEQKSLWALDHDHATGEARGWLCHPCNRAIGTLGDDVETLKRAIKHLSGQSRQIGNDI